MKRSLAALVIVLVAAAGAQAADVDGKAVYDKQCVKCHGPDGKGDTPAGKALKVVPLTDAKWAAADALPKIEAAVRDGIPRMPAMKDKMTAEEITAAAHYVQTLAKP